jgi:hypothetical protein
MRQDPAIGPRELARPSLDDGCLPMATLGPFVERCDSTGMYVCKRCDFAHGSENAFAVHLLQRHGARRLSSRYARDGYCPICLSCFPTREKNVLHFSGRGSRGFSACLLNLMATEVPLGDAEVDELNAIDRAAAKANRVACRTRAFCEAPCLVACGPARPIVVCNGMSRRSTSLSFGAALRRAVVINVGADPRVAGVIGDSMVVHRERVAWLAADALMAQRALEVTAPSTGTRYGECEPEFAAARHKRRRVQVEAAGSPAPMPE